jgi:hypothetical protein
MTYMIDSAESTNARGLVTRSEKSITSTATPKSSDCADEVDDPGEILGKGHPLCPNRPNTYFR